MSNAALCILLAVMMSAPVSAKQFSIKCSGGGFNYYVTFDTDMKRAVREVEIGGVKKGPITGVASDEIHFNVLTIGAPTRKLVWSERDTTLTWLAGPSGDATQSQRVDACERVELRSDAISHYDDIAPYTEPLRGPSH